MSLIDSMPNIEKLISSLGYVFIDDHLLKRALTHKSYANEYLNGQGDNEQLEFLGDAVIDLIVSYFLMRDFPLLNEGALTQYRAKVVNEQSLALLSRKLNLGEVLLLGKGESDSGGRSKNSVLANAYEALFGAIFLDGGMNACLQVATQWVLPFVSELTQFGHQDFKSELQKKTQAILGVRPIYQVLQETGPGHQRQFEVAVYVQNELIAKGIAHSKREAEQKAAQVAIAATDFSHFKAK